MSPANTDIHEEKVKGWDRWSVSVLAVCMSLSLDTTKKKNWKTNFKLFTALH